MSDQSFGAVLAVLGGFTWAVCTVGLVCYGIAWSRRHPAGAAISILLGVALLALGIAAIVLTPDWSNR